MQCSGTLNGTLKGGPEFVGTQLRNFMNLPRISLGEERHNVWINKHISAHSWCDRDLNSLRKMHDKKNYVFPKIHFFLSVEYIQSAKCEDCFFSFICTGASSLIVSEACT